MSCGVLERDIIHGVIKDVWHSCWLGGLNSRTGLGGSDSLAILIHVPHLCMSAVMLNPAIP
jgi:hypothetical protein